MTVTAPPASNEAPETPVAREVVITTWPALNAAQGKAVVVEGTVSAVPYQHMMPGAPDARHDIYLDLDGDAQVVVISRSPIECKKRVRIEGTVYEVSGAGKGGGDTYREPYVRAEKWSCLDR